MDFYDGISYMIYIYIDEKCLTVGRLGKKYIHRFSMFEVIRNDENMYCSFGSENVFVTIAVISRISRAIAY